MALLRTPFHAFHVGAGARMVEFAGFEMPVQYVGILEEHQAVRQAAGLFDVSHMGEVWVRGPKATDALQWLLTNDVASCAVGQAQYNCICNERGGVVDDVVIYRTAPDEILVCVNAANRDKDFAWFQAHNPFPEGARFDNESDDWAQVALQGPKARDILARLTDVDLDALGTYRFARGAVAGIPGCIVARTGYTGEDGFEVFAPARAAGPLWPAILEAGAPEGVRPIGLGARDTLRLEVRYCLYGHELNDDTTPLQAGLGWVTKLDKPFLGRDAIVARQEEPGAPRLCGLVVEGTRIPREGMAVLAGGADVGFVTSGTRSPSTGRGVALAYVRPPHAKPGTRLVIDVRGKEAEAVVHKGSFLQLS